MPFGVGAKNVYSSQITPHCARAMEDDMTEPEDSCDQAPGLPATPLHGPGAGDYLPRPARGERDGVRGAFSSSDSSLSRTPARFSMTSLFQMRITR